MREPKISFVSELKAQIINDLCRLQHYIAILTSFKSKPAFHQNGFIYGGAEACEAWVFRNQIQLSNSMFYAAGKAAADNILTGEHSCVHNETGFLKTHGVCAHHHSQQHRSQ